MHSHTKATQSPSKGTAATKIYKLYYSQPRIKYWRNLDKQKRSCSKSLSTLNHVARRRRCEWLGLRCERLSNAQRHKHRQSSLSRIAIVWLGWVQRWHRSRLGDDWQGVADQVVHKMLPHWVHGGIVDTVELIDEARWRERVWLGNIWFCKRTMKLFVHSTATTNRTRLTMTTVHFSHDLALRHGRPKEGIRHSIFFALSL